MGEVYRARDTRLDRIVAVKVVKERFSERFAGEARAVAALNHPNICTLYDVGPNYLVMEYVDGHPLEGPLPSEQALKYAVQICDALGAAHRRGVIHQDLKPGNILIAGSTVKLLDFGVAKIRSVTPPGPDETQTLELTPPGTLVGTPQYMSPEQIEGKPVDERSDIWAFGTVLYEMLTGKPAFRGASIPAVIAAVLREDPGPVSNGRTDVPAGFDPIVARCLEKDPSRRFGSMEEIRTALVKAPGAGDSRASIAVLPFANLSAEKENEYFGDGLAEEIINALTQVAGLRVIARTSAFVFRDKQEDVRRIAQQLGVANVLHGSVRRAGNRIRVTAQLITAADATQVWSSRYDREMTDVFAVQDEIAQAVVDALRERLGAAVAQQIVQRQIVDIESYHLHVKGRHHFYKLEPADMDTGRRLFEEALALDANYALPLVDVAHYYWVNAMTGRIAPREATTKGMQAAERALALDQSLGEAVGFRGRFRALYEYRWPEALRDLERALEMNPASALSPQGYAVVLTALNRLEEAVRQHERALKADPFSVLNQYFMARLMVYLGDFENARRHADLALELAPESWLAYSALGLVHLRAGRVREALASLEKTRDAAPARFITSGWRGCAYALAGQTEKAEHLARDLQEMRSGVSAAMIYAQLGNQDAVFQQLEIAVGERDFQLYNLQVDSAFESLRGEPRYRQLLQLMNLEA